MQANSFLHVNGVAGLSSMPANAYPTMMPRLLDALSFHSLPVLQGTASHHMLLSRDAYNFGPHAENMLVQPISSLIRGQIVSALSQNIARDGLLRQMCSSLPPLAQPFINNFSEQTRLLCNETLNHHDMKHHVSVSNCNPSTPMHGQNNVRQLQTLPSAIQNQDPTSEMIDMINRQLNSLERSTSHNDDAPRHRKRKVDIHRAVSDSARRCTGTRPPAPCRSATVRWTREEHEQFLEGLERFGVGQWCSIARHCVPTRSPSQVASHHQKFAIRSSLPQERRQKASLLDSTTPKVQRILAQGTGDRTSPPADAPESDG
jgi:SHAQKYF class myb-like DNA-binding protein